MCASPRTGCVRRITPIYTWREQAITEWSRSVACCHRVKLCALAARLTDWNNTFTCESQVAEIASFRSFISLHIQLRGASFFRCKRKTRAEWFQQFLWSLTRKPSFSSRGPNHCSNFPAGWIQNPSCGSRRCAVHQHVVNDSDSHDVG